MDDSDARAPADAPQPASAQARAMRRRLMERVADDDTSHRQVDAHDGEWQLFGDGVQIKVLHKQGGVLSYLLRLAPGACLPAHRHRHDEECVVLEGRLQLGSHYSLGPGGWHLAHAGALHATVVAPEGALIYLRGAVPDAGDLLG